MFHRKSLEFNREQFRKDMFQEPYMLMKGDAAILNLATFECYDETKLPKELAGITSLKSITEKQNMFLDYFKLFYDRKTAIVNPHEPLTFDNLITINIEEDYWISYYYLHNLTKEEVQMIEDCLNGLI